MPTPYDGPPFIIVDAESNVEQPALTQLLKLQDFGGVEYRQLADGDWCVRLPEFDPPLAAIANSLLRSAQRLMTYAEFAERLVAENDNKSDTEDQPSADESGA